MHKIIFLTLISIGGVFSYQNDTQEVMNIVRHLRWDKIIKYGENFSELNDQCKKHLIEYVNGIVNGEMWALEMFDSVHKIPDGIMMGQTQVPGHFDECVEISEEEFSGKHCMITLMKSKVPELKSGPNFMGQQMPLTYGLCVPSTCGPDDIKSLLKPVKGLKDFDFIITETDCSLGEFRPLRPEDWACIGLLIVLVLLGVASTVYDLRERFRLKNEKPNQLWTSFSIYSNTKILFKLSNSASQLKCLHGIRCLSLFWVVLCHSYMNVLFGAPVNPRYIFKTMNEKSFIPISNGFVSVDSFFFLSGLLVCVVFFRDISKKGSYDVPVAFLHRYMRLTPPLAILIFIQSTLFSRSGNGPFWRGSIDNTEKICRDSWWAMLLYVQNYVKPQGMCLGQSWYLSADMQMFWVSPLILYSILLIPSFAPYIMAILVLAFTFTSFGISYVNEMFPNFIMGAFTANNSRQFELEYIPFHTRMAPYVIGIATGYIICGIQAKKVHIKLSTVKVVCGWLACFALLGGSLYGIDRFMKKDYSYVESALYISFHRVGWALALSWVVIACVSGYGGPINDFLSMDIFQIIGKLSYSVFLIHTTIQFYRIYTYRTNQYLRHLEVVYAFCGDIMISCLIAIPFVILCELPFMHIDRYFLQKLQIFPFPNKSIFDTKKKEEVEVDNMESGKANPGYDEDKENEKKTEKQVVNISS